MIFRKAAMNGRETALLGGKREQRVFQFYHAMYNNTQFNGRFTRSRKPQFKLNRFFHHECENRVVFWRLMVDEAKVGNISNIPSTFSSARIIWKAN